MKQNENNRINYNRKKKSFFTSKFIIDEESELKLNLIKKC